MWNALPRLSLCIFWQAAHQLKHKIVGVASALCCVNACSCTATGTFDLTAKCASAEAALPWITRHVGGSDVLWRPWRSFYMCSSRLPPLRLCQRCHRDEGKQRKGTSVTQKPISRVCASKRSAGDTRDTVFKTEQQISSDFNHPNLMRLTRCPVSHTH